MVSKLLILVKTIQNKAKAYDCNYFVYNMNKESDDKVETDLHSEPLPYGFIPIFLKLI